MSLDTPFAIRKVAVLGAGVMGAQIAAHLANARLPTLLFDLASEGKNKNQIASNALEKLKKQKPSPLASKDALSAITPANYDEHLAWLQECDLVIEAIAERLDWKQGLYQKIAPHLGAHALLASNTSGLSINALSAHLPEARRQRFCGVHFFNPPRYMHLVELIPCHHSNPTLIAQLERFLVSTLGKGVIYAKDTPNFVANRIGMFSMMATLANAKRYNIRFDVVDDLTGAKLGRPKSATLRTADVVGLDTFCHVLNTMQDTLKSDPWHAYFQTPAWLKQCLENGALGAKTKQGIYKKEGARLLVLDPESGHYIPAGEKADDAVKAILKQENLAEKLKQLRENPHPQAQFLWACFRDTFHYIAYHLAEVAHCARDVDFAIRWGFGWQQGPFELWQAAGWSTIAETIQHDIQAGNALTTAPLPSWVMQPNRQGVHFPEGSYDPAHDALVPPSSLDVYKRQLCRPSVFGSKLITLGKTVFENDGLRAFTLDNEVLVVSFKTKMHTIGPSVLDGLHQVIDLAESSYRAMIIWQSSAPFSAGADLQSMMPFFFSQDWVGIEAFVKRFQDTSLRLRYCAIPVIAATQGYVFGGGCEFAMHCDKVVATLESYIGLVEVGVGILPAGGGCKEFALRAAQEAKGDIVAALKDYFAQLAMAKVATSALEAKEMGFLKPSDVVIFNEHELLYVAHQHARAMAETGYQPPFPPPRIPVAGRDGAATIRAQLLNLLEGHFISDHDYLIAQHIAQIMTGGDIDPGSLVEEDWLLTLERKGFMALLQTTKTQDRIANMLTTGKPLRN